MAFLSMLFSTAFNLAIGLMPLVDNFAHTGGFIAGLLMGLILMMQPEKLPNGQIKEATAMQKMLGMAGYIGLSTLIFTEAVCLYFEVDPAGWCSFCQYINCVNTPWWSCDGGSLANCKKGQQLQNGDAQVECIDGVVKTVKNATMQSQADLKKICVKVCT